MAILTHGSDMNLAPTLRPLVKDAGGSVRIAIERLAEAGFNALQLDGTLNGIRPRDLDHRGRHDLLGMMTRRSIRPAGIDFFIPRKHFSDPAFTDRAVTSTAAAIELAADLGRVPVSIALSINSVALDIRAALVEAADAHGVPLVVHAEDQIDALFEWIQSVDLPTLGLSIDPAAALSRGGDPVALIQRLAGRLIVGRLSDLQDGSSADDDNDAGPQGVRCTPGDGDLDLDAYRVSLDLCPRRRGPVILDLRLLDHPTIAANQARAAWESATFTA